MRRLIVILAVTMFVFTLTAFPTVSQEIDYCEGDFDGDRDVDGSDAAIFKADFGRGE